jgi:hypothetical protein
MLSARLRMRSWAAPNSLDSRCAATPLRKNDRERARMGTSARPTRVQRAGDSERRAAGINSIFPKRVGKSAENRYYIGRHGSK